MVDVELFFNINGIIIKNIANIENDNGYGEALQGSSNACTQCMCRTRGSASGVFEKDLFIQS